MILILPFIPSDPHYDFETTIEDVPYSFEVRWNERDLAWYFDISESDGTAVARGLKIVIGSYPGRYSTHELFQRGVFSIIDTSGEYEDAAFDDLGTRVQVRYYTTEGLVTAFYAV